MPCSEEGRFVLNSYPSIFNLELLKRQFGDAVKPGDKSE